MIVWECSLKGKHKLTADALSEGLRSWIYSDIPFTEIGVPITP
jgi:hypothetical protein